MFDVTKSNEELGKSSGRDAELNKATFPLLMGVEKSRKTACDLVDSAKRELASFDQTRVAPLMAIADYMVSRTK